MSQKVLLMLALALIGLGTVGSVGAHVAEFALAPVAQEGPDVQQGPNGPSNGRQPGRHHRFPGFGPGHGQPGQPGQPGRPGQPGQPGPGQGQQDPGD